MSVPTNNHISVKQYNEISYHKDLGIEVEKNWHLKTTIVPIIVRAFCMIKKRTGEQINKMPGSYIGGVLVV